MARPHLLHVCLAIGMTHMGCGSGGTGSIGGPTSPNDPGQPVSGTNETSLQNSTPSPSDSTPTSDRDATGLAKAAAITAAKSVAGAVATIAPLKDLQAIFESGLAPPICPVMMIGDPASTLPLTLDYGSGCEPGAFPNVSITGTAVGEFFTAFNAFNMDLSSMSIDGEAIKGTISGSVTRSSGVADFFGSLEASVGDGDSVRGSLTVSVAEATGAITISTASLTVTNAGTDTQSVDLEATRIDPATSGSFTPGAGTAIVNGSNNGNLVTHTIMFTPQTPLNGSVTVQ